MDRVTVQLKDLKIVEASTDKFKKSVGFAQNLPTEKQIDLLYCTALYASEGDNKNKDYFLRQTLIGSRKTPIMKFVDFQHNVKLDAAQSFKGQTIGICGHIYDAALMLENGDEQIVVAEDKIIAEQKDGQTVYTLDYPNAEKYRLHLLVAFVIYEFEFPDLAVEIKKSVAGDSKVNLSVSMEIMFSDYKLRVGKISPFETFAETPKGAEDFFKGNDLVPMLNQIRESGSEYKGKPVVRVMGGENFFSGMGIVFFPANKYSVLESAGDTEGDVKRICTPVSDGRGNVTMKCVVQAVASQRRLFMQEQEKNIEDMQRQELTHLKEHGLIDVKPSADGTKENDDDGTSFDKILLLYSGNAEVKGVMFIIGFPKDGGGSEVQSVLFNKKSWTEEKARKWLKAHKFHAGKIDVTDKYLRFRQKDPSGYKKFRIIKANTEGLINVFNVQLAELEQGLKGDGFHG